MQYTHTLLCLPSTKPCICSCFWNNFVKILEYKNIDILEQNKFIEHGSSMYLVQKDLFEGKY